MRSHQSLCVPGTSPALPMEPAHKALWPWLSLTPPLPRRTCTVPCKGEGLEQPGLTLRLHRPLSVQKWGRCGWGCDFALPSSGIFKNIFQHKVTRTAKVRQGPDSAASPFPAGGLRCWAGLRAVT